MWWITGHGHGERLSPLDASFLQLESPNAHMHVAWCSIFSRPDDASPPSIENLRASLAARLDSVPRCRQCLLPATLGLGEPRWVDDAGFDLADHLIQVGNRDHAMSQERFAAVRDALLSQPLDRTRPLWQLAFVPRLSDGRMAMIGRVHHAMADGAAALKVGMLLVDAEGAPERPPAPWRAKAAPSPLARVLDPFVHGAAQTTRAALDFARACEHPRSYARGALRDAGRVAQALAEDLLPHAPASQLNGTLGPRRTLVAHRVSLEQLRDITRGMPATRNDAGLAALAGALRELALQRGLPVQPLKALVPVNMRRSDENDELGNRVSITSVWLPLQLASAGARLESVRRQTARLQDSERSEGTQAVLSGLGLLPSPLRGSFVRAVAPNRFNLTISSVVGPPRALYMHGSRLEELYPVIPMADEQALSIGMLAYDGHLHVGMYADPDALPEATRLPALIDDELASLLRARSSRPQNRSAALSLSAAERGEHT